MNSIIKTTTLIALTSLFAINLNASVFNFTEESYIEDIPFNLTEIYNNIIAEQSLSEFDFPEEGYINDIPFDSGIVNTPDYFSDVLPLDFDFENESYIDDIPFNTNCISAQSKYNEAMKVEFNFEDEKYIDDIKL